MTAGKSTLQDKLNSSSTKIIGPHLSKTGKNLGPVMIFGQITYQIYENVCILAKPSMESNECWWIWWLQTGINDYTHCFIQFQWTLGIEPIEMSLFKCPRVKSYFITLQRMKLNWILCKTPQIEISQIPFADTGQTHSFFGKGMLNAGRSPAEKFHCERPPPPTGDQLIWAEGFFFFIYILSWNISWNTESTSDQSFFYHNSQIQFITVW